MRKLKLGLLFSIPVLIGLVVFAFMARDSADEPATGAATPGKTVSSPAESSEPGQNAKSAQLPAGKYIPDVAVAVDDKGPAFKDCLIREASLKHSPPCRFGAVGSGKRVVVFGDSHALHWTPALFEVAKKRGWEVTVLTRANCKPPLVEIDRSCETWRDNTLKRILREKPGLVVLGTNTGGNTTVLKDGVKLDRDAGELVLREGLVNTLNLIRSSGAEVTVMRDLPISKKYLPPECLGQNETNPEFCSFPKDRPPEHAHDLEAAKQVDGVQVIDPLPKVCPGERCQIVDGQILMFRDRGHMSATYNRTLAGWLGGKLQDPFGSR